MDISVSWEFDYVMYIGLYENMSTIYWIIFWTMLPGKWS